MGITSIQTRFISRDPEAPRRSFDEVVHCHWEAIGAMHEASMPDRPLPIPASQRGSDDMATLSVSAAAERLKTTRAIVDALKDSGALAVWSRGDMRYVLASAVERFLALPEGDRAAAINTARLAANDKHKKEIGLDRIPDRGFLTSKEVGHALGIGPRMAIEYAKKGKLDFTRHGDEAYFFRISDVNALKKRLEKAKG